MNKPRVSVVMPAHNREKYISSSIDSILMQTYKDFELIIVDDGSTDNTVNIIKSYDDPRIKLILHKENKGVALARNTGYSNSLGEFIVIADSDDINMPTKIDDQVEYLDNNVDIDIVGCIYRPFNEGGFLPDWFIYEENDYIKSEMIFFPGVPAASMFRAEKIRLMNLLMHDETYPACVDYEWYNKMPNDIRFANINKPLYLYRWHHNQISTKTGDKQKVYAQKIRFTNIEKLFISPTDQEMLAHSLLARVRELDSNKPENISFEEIKKWAEKLIASNHKHLVYERTSFEYIVSMRFYSICEKYGKFGRDIWHCWETYKYKDITNIKNMNIHKQKLIRIIGDKSVAIFGSLWSSYQILKALESVNISIQYIIDNNITQTVNETSWYSIYNEEILSEKPIDIVILSNLSESRFMLKEKLLSKYKNLKVVLIDQILE